jgi:CcmD family protein
LTANVAVWLGVGGYLLLLGAKQRRFETRLRQMEHIHDDS